MRRVRRERLLILLLAAAPLIAYAPAWREGRMLAPGDGAALHLPLRVEVFHAWQRGEVPSWNPSIFSGTPLIAAYRSGALHPLMLALAPASARRVPAAGARLARVHRAARLPVRPAAGAGPVGALSTGLGFALGPHLVAHLGDTATIVAAPALPLVLLAAESHLARPRPRAATLGLAAAVALVLLSGSVAAVLASALLVGARLVLAFFPRLLRGGAGAALGVASTAAAVLAGVLLAAPQLVPTLVALGEAGAGGAGAADARAAPLAGVAGFVVRYVSHSPAPIFALSAVPLLHGVKALRAAAAVVALVLVLFALRGGPDVGGPLPLAFDLALAVLAGLALDAQWRARREPFGRRVRHLALVAALFAAASLSVATTVTGPLAPELQAPVGLPGDGARAALRARGLTRPRLRPRLPAAARGVLPVAAARAPGLGRGARRVGAHPADADAGRARPRDGGARRRAAAVAQRVVAARARARDLAWANLASFSRHRNANGYDPMVPAARLRALGGMRSDGTASRELIETDPGRLELLGVRWVQVPTDTLAVPDAGRPRRATRRGARAAAAAPVRAAHNARHRGAPAELSRGRRLCRRRPGRGGVRARLASGREIWLPIRAGVETAEWAWDRPDLRGKVRHARPRVHATFTTGQGVTGNQYLAALRLPGRFAVRSLRFRAVQEAPPLRVVRAGLYDAETSRGIGLSTAAAFVSDEVRLAEAAGTPLVSLFEVRRGIGPAWVVESLRRLPDAERVLDVLRAPTRLGVDTRREAIAAEADVRGVTLPPGSRSQAADVARAAGGRIVVRAAGPGLLVIGEGYDAGFSARVDGATAEVLRVNGDRVGIVLQDGTHRVVLTHRARGFLVGL